MPRALVTGSAGLVGSATVAWFATRGWDVVGVDNDERSRFFGPAASTRGTLEALRRDLPQVGHHELDIRDEAGMARLFDAPFDLVVHAAAQPSHDWAAGAPLVDFEINAVATLRLLELVRRRSPEAVFVLVSTNKVYGDVPNELPFVEEATRWEVDPAHPYAAHGIDEAMRTDRCTHSLFGCSKLAADVLTQEYGRYYGLRTGVFRCGCITGGAHAAVELHGFLAYLVRCAAQEKPYVIYGHGGKQVRDNLHADDLAAAFEAFWRDPRPGEVYNLGGGRENSCSVREAIAASEALTGRPMAVTYDPRARKGDHVWWITDTRRFALHYPEWQRRWELGAVLRSLHEVGRRADAEPSIAR